MAVLRSANMSLGINLLLKLVKEAAEHLGKLYQLSRVEYSYKDEEILHKISIFWSYE